MMRSPKYRKGKKPAYSAPVAAMFILAAVLGMQFGCTDSATGPTVPQQTTLEKDIYATIIGDVRDLYTGADLEGVAVSVQSARGNTTVKTRRQGTFEIKNVFLGTISALSGGAGTGSIFESSEIRTKQFDLPLRFEVASHATWKERVVVGFDYQLENGTIIILSDHEVITGETRMMPYVQKFTGTVYAGENLTPAKGVTVMLDHTDHPYGTSDWPYCGDDSCEYEDDDYVRLVNSWTITDEQGIFTFGLQDKVVAYDEYEIIVYPYDEPLQSVCQLAPCPPKDEECVQCAGDGHYEFDTTEEWLNLIPKPGSHYDLMGYDGNGNVIQNADYAINLKDAENDIEVIYCSLEGTSSGNLLPQNYNNFSIDVIFNRPLKAWSFRLLKDDGRFPVAIKVEQTGAIAFSITPLESLNVAGNTWRFQIDAVQDYMGYTGPSECYNTLGGSSCRWEFNVAGFVPAIGPIAPRINANVSSSQQYAMAVPDRGAIYRLYKDFGPTNPGSVMSVMLADADMAYRINLAFDKPSAPVGVDSDGWRYYVFLADRVNTDWVQKPISVTYEDNQSVEGYISLPSNFDYTLGGDNNFLGDGNVLRMTVLPVNEDGFLDMSQLENIISLNVTRLRDIWGPMIVGDNRSIFGYQNGTVSANGGTLYDETANIAVHEILDASVAPTATESSANFDVEAIYMDEKHTFVTTQFQPTVTATVLLGVQGTNILVVDDVTGFYPGDNLNLYLDGGLSVKTEGRDAVGGDILLIGYDDTTNILILSRNLSMNHSAGEVVAMVGPMQSGLDAGDWTNRLRASTQDTAVYIAVRPDARGMLPGQMGSSVLIVNGQEIVPVTGVGVPTRIASPLLSAYVAGTSANTAMAGAGDSDGDCCDVDDVDSVANTVLLQPAAGGATSIMVEDGTDIVVGDWLRVGAEDYVLVATVVDGDDTEATVTFAPGQMLHYSYAARLTAVLELTVVSESATMLAYPLIDVYYGIDDLLPGATISILDPSVPENVYTSTVLSTYDAPGDNNWIGLSGLAPVVCEGTCQVSDFPYWSSVIAPANTRTEDSIRINVTDTSGNNSSATDKDGDGQADFDELELWSGGLVK